MKMRKGEYNVRLCVDSNGNISVGFLHRLYLNSRYADEWKNAPESTKKALKRILQEGLKEVG